MSEHNEPADGGRQVDCTDAMYAGLATFQGWLSALRREGRAKVEGRVVHLAPEVAARFCFGMVGGSFFVGMQRSELSWFEALPWSHASHRLGSTQLYLVARQMVGDGALLNNFAIELSSDSPAKLSLLSGVASVDVRQIILGENGSLKGVSARPIERLRLLVLEEGEHPLAEIREERASRARAAAWR